MNFRKSTLLTIALLGSPVLFGQFTQTWNTSDKLNSATAGFFYDKDISYNFRAKNTGNSSNSFGLFNYSTHSKNGKYGFGVNYFSTQFALPNLYSSNSFVKLNVNRQFTLNNGARLSAGAGVGGGVSRLFYSPNNTFDPIILRRGNAYADLGIAYATQRFKSGMSLLAGIGESGVFGYNLNAFASYTFGKEDKLQFTPYVSFNGEPSSLFSKSSSNFVFSGTFAYKSKFMLGGGIRKSFGSSGFITASYILNKKVKFTYSYDFKFKGINGQYNGPRSEFGIAFQLGKR